MTARVRVLHTWLTGLESTLIGHAQPLGVTCTTSHRWILANRAATAAWAVRSVAARNCPRKVDKAVGVSECVRDQAVDPASHPAQRANGSIASGACWTIA